MAFLSKLTLTQYKNFSFRELDFHAPVVGITGANGSGKTNLLDAIYYLCFTKSYFQNKEIKNVQMGKEGFRIEGAWGGIDQEKGKTIIVWREGKKTIEHKGLLYQKVTDFIGLYHAVMVAPDDIQIINGGSELRRKFFDGMLAQADPEYLEQLLVYQKTLLQKNAYLKTDAPQISKDLLDVYDERLAIAGQFLIEKRQELSQRFPPWLKELYERFVDKPEPVDLQYKSSVSRGDLLKMLVANRSRDLAARRCVEGPHTDDWMFLLKDEPIRSFGSQGQKKSFLIALKLGQLRWLQSLNKSPLLLLDDIFEKLDAKRLTRLFQMLPDFRLDQLFLTHTSPDDLKETLLPYFDGVQIIDL